MSCTFFTTEIGPLNAVLYRKYCERFADRAIVIITVSNYSLYFSDMNTVEHMKRYCTFLRTSELPYLKMKLYKLFRVVDYDDEIVNDLDKTGTVTILTASEAARLDAKASVGAAAAWSAYELRATGESRAARHWGYVCAGVPDGMEKTSEKAVREMISDALSKGFRPVLIVPPFLRSYNEGFPESFYTRFDRDLTSLAEQYGILYLNYARDTRFSDSPELFVDTDHLSASGSYLLMDLVFPEIESFYQDND